MVSRVPGTNPWTHSLLEDHQPARGPPALLEDHQPGSGDYLSNLHEHLKADSTVVEHSQIKGKADETNKQ